jgi:hypothetical protein
MNAIIRWFIRGDSDDSVAETTRREFKAVRPVLESLKAYDEGTKNISTSDIRERFSRVQNVTKQ